MHEDLIRTDRPLVQRLVDHVMSAGLWLEVGERNRFTAADIAAAPAVFNQRPDILRHVLSHPRDRITYAGANHRPRASAVAVGTRLGLGAVTVCGLGADVVNVRL